MHADTEQHQPRGVLEGEKKIEAQEQSQHKQMLENVPKSNKNTKKNPQEKVNLTKSLLICKRPACKITN